jgi:pimeloyl-ACP methyl ester carboxylesterase
MTIRPCLPSGGLTRRSALVVGAMAILAVASDAQAQLRPAVRPPVNRDAAKIYLMRGLFGIFSLGMDSLAAKLSAQGYSPTLLSWTDASIVVDQITAARRSGDNSPIILIGHSLGSNAVAGIATLLGEQNIPVDLVVTFDVTEPTRASANVRQFINFFQYNGFGRPVSAGPGFRGELQNIDLSSDPSLTHGNIDEAATLQAAVTERIFNITNQQMKTAAAAPKVRRP